MMETVLAGIGKQANLDRILFTPALKKIYFEMALASGGAALFKHADSARSGLSFIHDKAADDKHALLFCEAHELIHAYDMLLKQATSMVPVAVLAVKHTPSETVRANWSESQLANVGWLQFHTHTLQELYDHLAIAFNMIEEKTTRLPMLIMHSAVKHESCGEWKARDEVNLGNPLTGLQSKRAGKPKDFAAALASLKNKEKEKPTLRSAADKTRSALRDVYAAFGYDCPERGTPYAGNLSKADYAAITLIPAKNEAAALDQAAVLDRADCDWIRPLCLRPGSLENVANALAEKKRVAVVEPAPTAGVVVPPFFAEINALFGPAFKGELVSVVASRSTSVLADAQIKGVLAALENHNPGASLPPKDIL